MREIRFRAKTIFSREWRYGSLDRDEPQNKYYIMDNETGDGITIDENTIGQFTGLYDKNKVPIYEGDIVIFEDCEMSTESGYGDTFINQGVIEYNEENCCFNVTERITVELVDVLYKGNESLEVIGNIYENSDLLGE